MEKLINSLKNFGLTRYESQAYIALTKLITAQADEIAEISNLPRSKIYEILNDLEKKGYVEIKRERPLKYTVVSPETVFKKEKDKLLSDINSTEETLKNYYTNQMTEVQAPVWLIHTKEEIIKKEISVISKAKKSISIRIGFLLADEAEEMIKAFRKLSSDVEINIIANEYCLVDGEKIEIFDKFKNANLDNLKIIKANLPIFKILIRDSSEVFGTFVNFNEKTFSANSQSAVGVCNQYEAICKSIDDNFKKQFNLISSQSH